MCLEGVSSIVKFYVDHVRTDLKLPKCDDLQQSTPDAFTQDYYNIRDYLTGSFFTGYNEV